MAISRIQWLKRIAVGAAWAMSVCALVPAPALAQVSAATARTSGSFLATSTSGGYVRASFSCVGQPTCTGTYSGVALDDGCSNTLAIAGNVTVTGLDLSHPGTIQGNVTISNGYSSNGSPVCTYVFNQPPLVLQYAAT